MWESPYSPGAAGADDGSPSSGFTARAEEAAATLSAAADGLLSGRSRAPISRSIDDSVNWVRISRMDALAGVSIDRVNLNSVTPSLLLAHTSHCMECVHRALLQDEGL